MKNKLKNILLAASILAVAGCAKNLDTKPSTSIDQKDALKTSDDVKVSLVGAYADMGVSNFYGGRVFMFPELLGNFNDVDWSGTYQGVTQIYNKAIPVDNSFVASTWLAGYRAINDVNNVLGAISVVDEGDRDRVQGEAEFIRGSAYFDLVRNFAKAWNDGTPTSNDGVPIVLTPTTGIDESSKVKRNTVAEVYDQVIKDLTDAEAKLPETNGFFASKITADAMLARVYLQQQDYAKAAAKASAAISLAENNGYHLMNKYADAFPSDNGSDNTPEDLFAMQVTTSSGANSFNEFYSPYNRGEITITDDHLGLYENGDERLKLFYSISGSTYTGKFDDIYGNVHIIRLAEMYLIRAEANFRMGTSAGATPAADINTIRRRVGLDDIAAGELTLEDILKERKLELAFEGFTLNDIKRLETGVGNILAWNSPKLIYPIPLREIRVNPNLTQNEGYK